MFDQVEWFCAEWDYEQGWLTGVCIELSDDKFSLVGARRPGRVLAAEPVTGTWKCPRVLVEALVFRRVMKAIRRLPKDAQIMLEVVCTQFQLVSVNDEPVTDAPVKTRAVLLRLCTDGFEATLSVIQEKSPQYRKQFHREYATRVVCETAHLLNAVEMTYPAAQTYANAVKITVEDAKLAIQVPDVSPVIVGEVPLTTASGPGISVRVNASYLLSALKKLPASQLSLEFGEQMQQPIVLRSCGTEEYILLLQTMQPNVPA